jgi:hypothetical protein
VGALVYKTGVYKDPLRSIGAVTVLVLALKVASYVKYRVMRLLRQKKVTDYGKWAVVTGASQEMALPGIGLTGSMPHQVDTGDQAVYTRGPRRLFGYCMSSSSSSSSFSSSHRLAGATSGIGQAYARELAKRGMSVLIISRNPAKLEEEAKEIMALNDNRIQAQWLDYDFTRVRNQISLG